mgnify:CR=1 FL=1
MKISLDVIVKGNIDSLALYNEIKNYGVSVLELYDQTFVYGEIDSTTDASEKIIEACKKYGECEYEVRAI